MDGLVAVGTVPDEVLLLCGRPAAAPSDWWTPGLVDRSQQDVDRLRAAACEVLDGLGVRDRATGGLRGPLGQVAEVVADATVLLLLETDRGDGVVERRSIVAADDRAVLDHHGRGVHDLLLAGPSTTALLLADLLAGEEVPIPSADVLALAGRRSVAEVGAVLRPADRTATIRVTRSATGDDAPPTSHLVTVVHHPDGHVACWALADGSVRVHALGDDVAAADLAVALLGASVGALAG